MLNASKCAIYQIKLTGSIRLRAQLISSLIATQQAHDFDVPVEHDGTENNTIVIWSHRNTHLLPELVSCPVELSDFNPQLGTTGEFDGVLRLKSSCSIDPFSKFTNDGECTPHLILDSQNLS